MLARMDGNIVVEDRVLLLAGQLRWQQHEVRTGPADLDGSAVRTGPADLDGSAVSFADYSAAFSAHERTVQPSIRLDWRNCLIAESMEETQHITRADMNKGQIRIPARVVQAMRMSSGRFQFEFETGTVTAAFRDGKSADLRTRSGTIAVGKVQMRTLVWHNQVVEGEKMRIVRESDSVFKLSRRSYAAAMADAPLQ